MKKIIPAAILLLVFLILCVSTALRTSGTCDEIAHHIPVGYILLTKGDFKMDSSHPPLSRYIVSLPLKLFMPLKVPADKTQWRRPDRSEFGRDFFFTYNHQPRRMLFYSRLAVILVSVICGLILFFWANALYGNTVAFLSLLLYSFSPNILAHAGLATTDMTATCCMLLSIATFWLFTKNASLKNVIRAGFCLGLAQLSKYTAILLYPIFLLLWIFELKMTLRGKRKSFFFKLMAVIFISLIVIWVGYGFATEPILKDAMRVEEKLNIAHTIVKKISPSVNEASLTHLDNFLLHMPVPCGTHLLGILGVFRHGYEGHGTYFLGRWLKTGSPFYFLVAFFIKTPIPTIIFLFIGFIMLLRKKIERNERFIFLTIAIFFITASLSSLQLGLRYILPIYPFFFIIAAKGIEALQKKRAKVFAFLLLVWLVVSSLLAWPNFLSYFNELIGGPDNGYKFLRDSNLDWGQDLPALAKYLKRNNISEVTFEYFGQDEPAIYGINSLKFSKEEFKKPLSKVYAISVQYLDSVEWTKSYIPSAKAGYSIFIYDLRR
jgi:4-amino-4-deoxy-L-arabinose transferase-like glycosyltransferase